MAVRHARVLIVEDVRTLAETYLTFLTREGVEATSVATGAEALGRLGGPVPDILVLDVNLPDMSGLDVLREVRRRQLPVTVIVITSNASINTAVEAMREGAFDFIVKPFTADRLRVTVRNAVDHHRLEQQVDELRNEFGRETFCGFIGQSLAMQAVYRIVQSAAPSKASVFITGESGTGKEVCAEAIHRLSKRGKRPFIAVNCAAIPHELLESELFGHVKGAFTGASSDRLGAALRADGGTLFLDEIGEMRPDFQAKMLRFLQTGSVQRVGEDKIHGVDVRIVCATNRDPEVEVKAGRFREDLYYRLHVIPIEMPPLRDRDDDVLLLSRHFLQIYAAEDGKAIGGFTLGAEEALLAYAWPGNVRELQNVIRKAVILGSGPLLDVDALSIGPAGKPTTTMRTMDTAPQLDADAAALRRDSPIVPLDTVIDLTIEAAIARCNGSIPRAAAALKVSPSTIYRRLQSKGVSER